MTELLEALYRGDADRVSELRARRPELNVFEAAAFGETGRLRELLDREPASANEYGDDGFQPLGLACFFGHVASARLLLERGADPNTLARNEHIQSNALHAAAASENKGPEVRYELCELLLDRGADPNVPQGIGGFRAIDAARQNGDERLEQLLKERGADG
jgi:ankyrin repeat protein